MKNKLNIPALLLCAALMGSCSLEEKPYGFFSSGNFYKTEQDAESGLMYAYNALNYLEYLRGIWYVGDIPTETMYPKLSEPGDIHMLEAWTVNAETELTTYFYKYCYIGINRANTVIERVDNSKLSETVINRVTGEAYFLRAWNYFNLVRTFGVVPIYTEPIESLDQTTPPLADGISQLYDLIISDLRKAESLLGVNKVFGRADIVAAQALLSKVYITIASSVDYNAPGYGNIGRDAQIMYDSAAYYSRKVINDYQAYYSFDDDLLNIYDVNKPDGPEHIFIMAIDRSGTHEGQYSKIPLQFLPDNGAAPLYMHFSDGSVKKGNGNGWGVFLIEENFVNEFPVTDRRRYDLMHNTFYQENGDLIPTIAPGYYSAKYVDPDFIGERTSARPYLIRYSDIALIFAEAAGPGEGLDVVNRIRDRAGVGPLTASSLEEFRKQVIKERSFELAFEGNRLFDLRRTASVVSTVLQAQKNNLTEEQTAFYPIPQRELDLNPNVNSSNNNF